MELQPGRVAEAYRKPDIVHQKGTLWLFQDPEFCLPLALRGSRIPKVHVAVSRARCTPGKQGCGSRLSPEPRAVLVPLGFQRINEAELGTFCANEH